jgi:hypothetical protein
MLEKSLPLWLDTLDLLTVVTDYDTLFSLIGLPDNFRTYRTDLFTAHGASFNKGAALSAGFAFSGASDWVLNFDADIIPPADWRQRVERLDLQSGKLYGCSHRYGEDDVLIPDADFPNIWGFFHLWNVADSHSWRRPVFDATCGHAGNYDHTFMMQWPEEERVDLWPEIKVIHQGDPRQYWFGRDPKNEKRMTALFTLGLYDAWQLKAGHIKPPEPHKVCIEPGPQRWVMQLLSDYTTEGPFLYQVRVGNDPKPDEEFISSEYETQKA